MRDTLEVQVCGICYKKDDAKLSGNVEWIQCEQCSLWYIEIALQMIYLMVKVGSIYNAERNAKRNGNGTKFIDLDSN